MTPGMPTDNIRAMDIDAAVSRFRGAAADPSAETLLLPGWGEADWRRLFADASTRTVPAGEALIRRGENSRTLFIVLDGELEVIAHSIDGISLGRLAVVKPGSVLGEQAFFDAGPRSAGAWAITDCEVAAITPEQYAAFEEANPGQARDLLFALGRILAIRLRKATATVAG